MVAFWIVSQQFEPQAEEELHGSCPRCGADQAQRLEAGETTLKAFFVLPVMRLKGVHVSCLVCERDDISVSELTRDQAKQAGALWDSVRQPRRVAYGTYLIILLVGLVGVGAYRDSATKNDVLANPQAGSVYVLPNGEDTFGSVCVISVDGTDVNYVLSDYEADEAGDDGLRQASAFDTSRTESVGTMPLSEFQRMLGAEVRKAEHRGPGICTPTA